jgi:hypothetical protein
VISDVIEQFPGQLQEAWAEHFDHSGVCALKPPQRRFDLHQSRQANPSLSNECIAHEGGYDVRLVVVE